MLDQSVENIRNNKTPETIETQNNKANKPMLLFPSFQQEFPKVKLATDLE